jgi:hypothetical protein
MEGLPLPVIGWIFTVGCACALLLGTWLTIGVFILGGKAREELAARLLEDLLLFSIWLLGLTGGIGVLLEKGWSRPVLELFCWTLMILLGLSAWKRMRAATGPKLALGLSLALFIVPVFAVCVATILTLRSEAAMRHLSAIVVILIA